MNMESYLGLYSILEGSLLQTLSPSQQVDPTPSAIPERTELYKVKPGVTIKK